MTKTLTEARRALLELQSRVKPGSDDIHRGATYLTTIAAYLDQQVALNIENLPSQIRGNTFDLLIIDDPIIRGGEKPTYQFAASSRHALTADVGDRRYVTTYMPDPTFRGNRPTPTGPQIPIPSCEELNKIAEILGETEDEARVQFGGDNA